MIAVGKKIVILNGSPRRKGNTSMLVKAFAEGAESAGNTVTEFFLDSMDIHGCKGCFCGHSGKECPCVQKDDMALAKAFAEGADLSGGEGLRCGGAGVSALLLEYERPA